MRSVEAFSHSGDARTNKVLVLHKDSIDAWRDLCEKYHFSVPHRVVAGGKSRFLSVKYGLRSLSEESDQDVVAVHDGVRPLLSRSLIEQGFAQAQKVGSAVPCVPISSSIRRKTPDGGSRHLKRDDHCFVQTPQFFALSKLKQAFEVEEKEDFTDEASVWEHAGHKTLLTEGQRSNIKITHEEDLSWAEMWLRSRAGEC